jgi:hypothetical protein
MRVRSGRKEQQANRGRTDIGDCAVRAYGTQYASQRDSRDKPRRKLERAYGREHIARERARKLIKPEYAGLLDVPNIQVQLRTCIEPTRDIGKKVLIAAHRHRQCERTKHGEETPRQQRCVPIDGRLARCPEPCHRVDLQPRRDLDSLIAADASSLPAERLGYRQVAVALAVVVAVVVAF